MQPKCNSAPPKRVPPSVTNREPLGSLGVGPSPCRRATAPSLRCPQQHDPTRSRAPQRRLTSPPGSRLENRQRTDYVRNVRPLLLSAAEHLGRRALLRRGAVSTWFPTRHGHVHCYRLKGHGSLPPVVLLHGLGTAATAFAPLIAQLRPHVRELTAPDSLGHGFSSAQYRDLSPSEVLDSTFDVLRRTIDEPVVLVGNSMGGALALKFAVQHPEKVRALALVSPAGAPFDGNDWKTLTQTFDVHSRAEARHLLTCIYPNPPWFLSLVAHEMAAHLSSPALRALLASPPSSADVSPSELATIAAPLLLLWGARDRLLPRGQLEYFRRHLPSHAVIEEPPTFGHSPHLDAPRALAERLVRFTRTLA